MSAVLRSDGTVSVGAVSGAPGADLSAMLSRADVALYRAKANGRNRVETGDDVVPTPGRAPATAAGVLPQFAFTGR